MRSRKHANLENRIPDALCSPSRRVSAYAWRHNVLFPLILTVLCLFVLTHVFSHSHAKNQSEAACQLCQAAHGQSILPGQVQPDAAALTSIELVQPVGVSFVEFVILEYSASRAPPAL